MSEQGLKAVVYPEWDVAQTEAFVATLSEMLAQLNIPIGVDVSESGSSDGSGGGGGSPSSSGSSGGGDDKGTVEKTAEGVKKGLKDSADGDPGTHEKMQMPTKLSLSSILSSVGGIAGAVGVGAVTVAGATVGIFKFLESASPPLKNVMDLFSTAFNLIWMPIGTLIAVQMMPTLVNVFNKVAKWVSIAMTLYGEDGTLDMSSLIAGAIDTSFEVLLEMLKDETFLETVGRLLWTGLEIGMVLLLSPLIGPEGAVKYVQAGLDMVVALLSAVWHFLTLDWDALGGDLEKMGSSFDKMDEILWSKLPEILEKVVQWIGDNTFFGKVIKKLDEWLDSITGKSVGEHFETMGENISSGWDTMTSAFASGDWGTGLSEVGKATVVGQVGKALGWWAEGGIITQPTLGVAGEAGPEAIIPLNQLHQVANDITTINGGNGGNVMNFYIDGAKDPVAVGEEVQRILEKTVGKASSKMPWW